MVAGIAVWDLFVLVDVVHPFFRRGGGDYGRSAQLLRPGALFGCGLATGMGQSGRWDFAAVIAAGCVSILRFAARRV